MLLRNVGVHGVIIQKIRVHHNHRYENLSSYTVLEYWYLLLPKQDFLKDVRLLRRFRSSVASR
jgi:hypothetical protein